MLSYPKLIDPCQFHAAGKIQIDLELVIGIRGYHERPRLHGQQIVFAYSKQDQSQWGFKRLPDCRNSLGVP
jgi:hypothetical protein